MISINMSELSLPREIVVSREVIEALADNGCCPKHDAKVRGHTIEICAEIIADHMRCFECNLDCKEADIDTCRANIRLFLDNLMKGEAE